MESSPKWQRWKGIMKCYPFEEKRLSKWQPPYIVQPKYDGVRCRAIPTETGYILFSSEENVIFSVPHINEELDKTASVELDGELYCHGMSFEEIVSITSRTVNLHPNSKEMNFYIFDVVSDWPQGKRTKWLSDLEIFTPHLIKAPFWLCNSLDDIMKTYDHLVNENYEGIIVRHLFAPYVRKRSTMVMKFKPKKEDSYEIISYSEEISKEGTPKGTLGSLTCRSGDGNYFDVGTGYSADQRRELWTIREALPGMVAKVKYQHLTDRKVPRFPVFVEVEENGR